MVVGRCVATGREGAEEKEGDAEKKAGEEVEAAEEEVEEGEEWAPAAFLVRPRPRAAVEEADLVGLVRMPALAVDARIHEHLAARRARVRHGTPIDGTAMSGHEPALSGRGSVM